MKTTITVSLIVIILSCLFIGDVKINLSPFTITMPGWPKIIAISFIICGIAILNHISYMNGRIDAIKECIKEIDKKENEIHE